MNDDDEREACGCPRRDAAGHIRHQRGVCTDPIVAAFNWFAELPEPPDWPCEAYGPDGLEIGAYCFVSDLRQRSCASAAECQRAMTFCRQQVHQRINELAASGDTTAAYLADQFPTPDAIFGGDSPGLQEE
jgi:hypothetical protein